MSTLPSLDDKKKCGEDAARDFLFRFLSNTRPDLWAIFEAKSFYHMKRYFLYDHFSDREMGRANKSGFGDEITKRQLRGAEVSTKYILGGVARRLAEGNTSAVSGARNTRRPDAVRGFKPGDLEPD